jgi:hypothetical protein
MTRPWWLPVAVIVASGSQIGRRSDPPPRSSATNVPAGVRPDVLAGGEKASILVTGTESPVTLFP